VCWRWQKSCCCLRELHFSQSSVQFYFPFKESLTDNENTKDKLIHVNKAVLCHILCHSYLKRRQCYLKS
jgi:hypothetical protein